MTEAKFSSVIAPSAPYGFVRNRGGVPLHKEVVTLKHRGVLCHNGCGLYYVPAEGNEERHVNGCFPVNEAGAVCPDCNEPPKKFRIGTEPEEVATSVRIVMGNMPDVRVLQPFGKVQVATFGIQLGKPQAHGRVTNPSDDR